MTDQTDWQQCRIGSCQRHQNCMYRPCRNGFRDRLRAAEGMLDAILFVETLEELDRAKDRIRELLDRQPDRVIRE